MTGDQIVIYDHAPIGLTFEMAQNPEWFAGASGDSTIITDPIEPGDSAVVKVRLRLNTSGTTVDDYTNFAEIGYVEDEEGNDISDADQDSTPDNDPDDDAGGEVSSDSDDVVDGDGSGMPGDEDADSDEDDHDPAFVRYVDLALTKMLVHQDSTYGIGDTVDFVITIYNQGNIPASNVLIHDYTPEGLAFDPSLNDGWSLTPNPLYPDGDTYSTTLSDTVYPDQVITDTITLTVEELAMVSEDSYTNVAEIGMFTDTTGMEDISNEDIDSPSDMDPTDDAGGDTDGDTDDEIDGDGSGDPGDDDELGDEDNSDPSGVRVVDFALKKTTPSFGPFFPGEPIPYDITVYNQGNVPSAEMIIYDHIPAGLDYIDDDNLNDGWMPVNDSLVSYTYSEIIGVGDSAVVRVYMTPNGTDLTLPGLTNIAEIGYVEDIAGTDISSFDIDSTPDDSVDNDEGGMQGSDTDDTINNENGDEDDADPEAICSVVLTCPEDITAADCYEEPFTDAEDAGLVISCNDFTADLTHNDEVEPADCTNGEFFSERVVNRTYNYVSELGGFDVECTQEITYNFTECNQLTDYGVIAIENNVIRTLPSVDCPYIPTIEETQSVQGGCGHVEYMWLISTQERTDGQPFIPNEFNMGPAGSGAIWEIIDGALDPYYTPASITQNTYFVRCARDISCCDFGESNLVGYRISQDAGVECPIPPVDDNPNTEDCDNDILLLAGDDNMMSGQQLEFKTNKTIDASNRVGSGAKLIYNAKEGTILTEGFQVDQNAELEITTTGCDNEE